MAHWYEPRKAWKERKARKKVEAEAKGYLGSPPLFNYPLDKPFSTPFARFLVIRKGYAGVRTRFGTAGDVVRSVYDHNGRETDDAGKPIRVTEREFPYGGLAEPGLRFMLGLGGLWTEMAVVNMKLQTDELPFDNVPTKGGTPIRGKLTLDWQVRDPVRAILGAENYRKTLYETAQIITRNTIQSSFIDDLEEIVSKRANLMESLPSIPKKLIITGVEALGLYVSEFNLPQGGLADVLAAEEAARSQAKMEVELAEGTLKAAEKQAAAAKMLQDPVALEVFRTTAALKGKGVTYNASNVAVAQEIRKALESLRRRGP